MAPAKSHGNKRAKTPKIPISKKFKKRGAETVAKNRQNVSPQLREILTAVSEQESLSSSNPVAPAGEDLSPARDNLEPTQRPDNGTHDGDSSLEDGQDTRGNAIQQSTVTTRSRSAAKPLGYFQGPPIHEVERIVNVELSVDEQLYYEVKFKNMPKTSWHLEEDFCGSCKALLEQARATHAAQIQEGWDHLAFVKADDELYFLELSDSEEEARYKKRSKQEARSKSRCRRTRGRRIKLIQRVFDGKLTMCD